MAFCTDVSNDTTISTTNILITSPVTPPNHTPQSTKSRHIEQCDSGYSSDFSTASTSKSRTCRRPIEEVTTPTPLRCEKQRLIKTTTSPYPSRTRTLSTTSQSSAPPRTHRNHRGHSFAAHATRHHSTPCSRRSSFLIRAPNETHPASLSSFSHNQASSVNSFLLYDNPFLQQPVLNSQSRPSSPTPSKTPSPGLTNQSTHIHSPSLPSYTPQEKENLQPRYTNYVPAPTIGWTLPSTQQQKHKQTAKSSQGIRGLWRKLFCKKEGYVEGDHGCVRRYVRSDWKKGNDEDESMNLPHYKQQEKLSGWTCFAIEKGES